MVPARGVLNRLYISHTLSTWNSRTFEFGAVLFLASLFPGTLFYASFYALSRAAAAAILSSWVGHLIDRWDRLRCVRASIVWQRLPVAISCIIFVLLSHFDGRESPVVEWALFGVAVVLACVEKVASVANTVSVERDWIIVISEDIGVEREDLNASMRRIDLLAKLLAPVLISLIYDYSFTVAIWVVFAQNTLSVLVEYFAIAQVYHSIPGLANIQRGTETAEMEILATPTTPQNSLNEPQSPVPGLESRPLHGRAKSLVRPWIEYFQNPAVLPSLSLSILYLTVLSTGVQMQAYLFTLGFTSIEVSLMRFAAVIVELLATWAAPVLTRMIGPVRAALWFVNEQLVCVGISVALYLAAPANTKAAGFSLIGGVTFSRLGLWGFDLCVQYLIQEETPESTRGQFSATEMALQNFFELLSFGTTVVFSRPEDFKYPVVISSVAVTVSACVFAAFVRKRRGHLFHASQCMTGEKYQMLSHDEPVPTRDEEREQV